jgi:acetate---CoA ligase (ADP-forming)
MPMPDPLQALLAPRSIAVVGASPKGGYGLQTIANLRELGSPAAIYPVHPRHAEVDGLRAYPDLASLPEVPDAVAVAVPAAIAVDVLEQAGALGVRAGVVYASGFTEAGGDVLQARFAEVTARTGMRVLGPNCLGLVNYRARTAMWGITMSAAHGDAGRVAVVSQSGNMGLTLMLASRGLDPACVVTCGNQADLDLAEILDHLAEDEAVRVVACVIEGLTDVPAFRAAAQRAAERDVAVVAVKIGRSARGRQAALAHTGSMAGQPRLYDALFEECGVVLARDLDDLEQTARLLAADRRPAGRRLGILASSGGECGLVSDLAEDHGLVLPPLDDAQHAEATALLPDYANPGNPLDVTAGGWGDEAVYRQATEVLARSADVVACIGDAPGHSGAIEESGWPAMVRGLVDGAAVRGTAAVHVTTLTEVQPELLAHVREQGAVTLLGLEAAVRAIGHAARWHEARARVAAGAMPRPVLDPAGAAQRQAAARRILAGRVPGTSALPESAGKAILSLYGIPVPVGRVVASADEAVAAATALGGRVVLKLDGPDLLHKSELGAVRVGLHAAADVARAFGELAELAAAHSEHHGVRVEAMAPAGQELIVGGGTDPLFGAHVMVGAGGIHAELLDDHAHGLGSIGADRAAALVASLRMAPVLAGARGAKPADVTALADVVARTSQLLAELPEVRDLDINPVIVHPAGAGCTAVDALLVL